MSDLFEIEITENQRSILIDYVCDWDITKWVEAGKKIAEGKYCIAETHEQLEEIIAALRYLVIKAEYNNARNDLKMLSDYLEHHYEFGM